MKMITKQLCIGAFLVSMSWTIRGMHGGESALTQDVDDLLIDALRSHDISLMSYSLDYNPSSQAKNLTLIQSAYEGNVDAVRMLLACNVDVNACNKYFHTALMQASYKNTNNEIVEALLEAKADINARNRYGWNALIIASYSGSVDVVHLLVHAGADVKARDADGRTALTLACSGGHLEAVQKLLELGADVMAQDCSTARECGYTRLVQLLENIKALREEWGDCPLDVINSEIVPYVFSGEESTNWSLLVFCKGCYCALCDNNFSR